MANTTEARTRLIEAFAKVAVDVARDAGVTEDKMTAFMQKAQPKILAVATVEIGTVVGMLQDAPARSGDHRYPAPPPGTKGASEAEFRAATNSYGGVDGGPAGDYLKIGYMGDDANLVRGALVKTINDLRDAHPGGALVWRWRPTIGQRRKGDGMEWTATCRVKFLPQVAQPEQA